MSKITTAQSINLQEWNYLIDLHKYMQIAPEVPGLAEEQLDFNNIPEKRKKLFQNMVLIDIESWFKDDGQGFFTKLPFNMVDNQFFILKYRNQYFFSNNEGYDYCKYILRLVNYSE